MVCRQGNQKRKMAAQLENETRARMRLHERVLEYEKGKEELERKLIKVRSEIPSIGPL